MTLPDHALLHDFKRIEKTRLGKALPPDALAQRVCRIERGVFHWQRAIGFDFTFQIGG